MLFRLLDGLRLHALHGPLDVEEDCQVITLVHFVTKPATGSASTIKQWGATPLSIVTTLVLICLQLAALLSTRLSTLRVAESSIGGGGIDSVKCTGVISVGVDDGVV
jgi:hypothetical protein